MSFCRVKLKMEPYELTLNNLLDQIFDLLLKHNEIEVGINDYGRRDEELHDQYLLGFIWKLSFSDSTTRFDNCF